MKWIKNFGLPTKFTFVFILAVYLPIFIVGFFSLDLAKETEKKYGLKLYSFIADMNNESLSYQLSRLKNELGILSKINHLQDLLKIYEENPLSTPETLNKNKNYQAYLSEFTERLKLVLNSNPNLLGIGFYIGNQVIIAIEKEKTTSQLEVKNYITIPPDLPKSYMEWALLESEGMWYGAESFLFPFDKTKINYLTSYLGYVGKSIGPKGTPFQISFHFNPWAPIKGVDKEDLKKLERPFTLLLKEEADGKVTDLFPKLYNTEETSNLIKQLPSSFLIRDIAEYVDSNLNIYSIRKVPLNLNNLEKISVLSFYPSKVIRRPLEDTRNIILKFFIICTLVISPLIFLGLRKIISNLHFVVDDLIKTSKTLEKSTKEIESTSEILKKSSNFNQKSVDSISSSMEQFAFSSQQTKDKIREMNVIFKKTSESATEGKNDINDLALSMDQIVESSKNIFKIINIIENISIQTNILSMNASVEAVRAGEHGKGFAVVAEAIRNLAQKSSSAAGEIGKLIQDSIDKSQNGSIKANRNLGKFKEIIHNVESTTKLVESSSKTLDERLVDIQKLSIEIKHINTSLHEGTLQTEKHRDIARQLSEEAESLKQSIHKIIVMVEGEKDNNA